MVPWASKDLDENEFSRAVNAGSARSLLALPVRDYGSTLRAVEMEALTLEVRDLLHSAVPPVDTAVGLPGAHLPSLIDREAFLIEDPKAISVHDTSFNPSFSVTAVRIGSRRSLGNSPLYLASGSWMVILPMPVSPFLRLTDCTSIYDK